MFKIIKEDKENVSAKFKEDLLNVDSIDFEDGAEDMYVEDEIQEIEDMMIKNGINPRKLYSFDEELAFSPNEIFEDECSDLFRFFIDNIISNSKKIDEIDFGDYEPVESILKTKVGNIHHYYCEGYNAYSMNKDVYEKVIDLYLKENSKKEN